MKRHKIRCRQKAKGPKDDNLQNESYDLANTDTSGIYSVHGSREAC